MRGTRTLLVLVLCLPACVFAQGWTRVGGMALNYDRSPAATPPGAYQWPWDSANPDGPTVTYGAFTWPGNGGLRYGILSVDNSIASDAAYITQTIPVSGLISFAGIASGDAIGQQFLHWTNPSAGNGTTGVWVDVSYGNSQVQHFTASAGSSWQWPSPWTLFMPSITPTEFTIKIGITKDPAVTTGTRTLMVEDAPMWTWGLTYIGVSPPTHPQWNNFDFDLPADWRDWIVAVLPSSNPLLVSEYGPSSTTFKVFCVDENHYGNIPPTANVTVTIDPDTQTRINTAGQGVPVNLTFTPVDYNVPQTVTVTAIDDAIVQGLHTSTINFAVSSGDTDYAQTIIPPLTVQVQDNDAKEILVTPLVLALAEPNTPSGTYTVRLGGAPSSNVTVTATRSLNRVTVNGGSSANLIFTPANYATPQIVTVQDIGGLNKGPQTVTITHSSVSSDTGYNALTIPSVVVSVAGNGHYCGEPGQQYQSFDLAGAGGVGTAYRDCYVDFYDVAALASQWLVCTDRFKAECVQW